MTEKLTEGQLSDDELDDVSGGGCSEGQSATWNEGGQVTCTTCGRVMPAESVWLYTQNADGTIMCETCEEGQSAGDIAAAYDRVAERNR